MSEYQALYRKWRPQNFSDVIGQSHIVDTLKNEIKSGRIAHAYLFCGTRGTGKTTTAKLLSRAVNCTSLLTNGEPCNKCESCIGILNGSIMDVSEIDAASNNGVDSIRGIRNEVIYAPANVKYRVYIIDEVHMLSTAAFNALLKTLEEPPSHVIFILATTEANKIPATVQSRCQRFDFTRITVNDIAHRLSLITEQDEIKITHDAIRRISAVADGSMRDALSILEQCTAAEEITLEGVESLIGITGHKALFELVDFIYAGDAGNALVCIDKLINAGKDAGSLFDSLLNHYREMLIARAVEDSTQILSCTDEQLIQLKTQSNEFSYESIIYAIREISQSIAAAKWAACPRILLEACIVKLCKPELSESADAILARISNLESNRVTVQRIEIEKQPDPKEHNEVIEDECPVADEKPQKIMPSPANADELVKKIINGRPRMRPNLLNTTASFEDDVLTIVQPKQIAYNFLCKPEEIAAMEEIAGCKVNVVKSQDVQTEVKQTKGIDELIAQKELFGDKMVILGDD